MRTEKTNPESPSLSDAVIASLEDYLPGGVAVAEDGGEMLQNQITAALARLEQGLALQSRTMTPSDAFRKLTAARHAVQAAKLAMQLHNAGREASPN
jgi:hypothetical protein